MPALQIAVVQWEIILGICLVTGYKPSLTWLASFTTFTIFAIVSATLGWNGVARCGCLGNIPASPWHAFTTDLIALLALLFVRPSRNEFQVELSSARRWISYRLLRQFLGVLATIVLLATLMAWRYGSLESGLAQWRDETVSATPSYLAFGRIVAGEAATSETVVSNHERYPFRIIGGSSDCSCVVTRDLPITIPSGETRAIQISLHAPGNTIGSFTRVAKLYTDHPQRGTLLLRVGCRVVAPGAVPGE